MILASSFDWCDVSAGSVTLKDASKREGTKGGSVLVDAFAIAKYPITNQQFQVYLTQTSQETVPTAFEGDDLPRTNVSWYEATAFCDWLARQMGQHIMLPTEAQWQRAAQGDNDWLYPWGQEADASRFNDDKRHQGVTPVTQFPEGASPFGVMDMSGNVFEWCLDKWGTDYNGPLSRTLRGGAWDHGDYNAQVTFRGRGNPEYRYHNVGFRPALLFRHGSTHSQG